VDRCAGRRLAGWLQGEGHDVLEARTLGADPGDRALLELAASENRVLITIDTDFGELVYLHDLPHAGLVRLPDVPAERRIALMAAVIDHHGQALGERAIVTIRGERIRISLPPLH
jgi:predicted nuclease of predicted toxin-antitoxin system